MIRTVHWSAAAVLAGLALTVAACSSAASSTTVVHKESDVVSFLHLTGSDNTDWTYAADDGTTCDVVAILTTKVAVQLYTRAGDIVAVNKSGNVGLKVDSGVCQGVLSQALWKLTP